MKKVLIIAISVLLLTACSKKSSNSPTTTNNTPTPVDTITIVDNGTTYTYTSNPKCVIQKTSSNSIFSFGVIATSTNLISMSIAGVIGPINSLGIYKVSPVDSVSDIGWYARNNSTFTETFSGGENYTVDSIMVNITVASGSTVVGNYQVWLNNAAGSKVVTGIINCVNANIN